MTAIFESISKKRKMKFGKPLGKHWNNTFQTTQCSTSTGKSPPSKSRKKDPFIFAICSSKTNQFST